MKNLALLLVLVALTGGFWVLVSQMREQASKQEPPVPAAVSPVPAPSSPAATAQPVSSATRVEPSRASAEKAWPAFRAKFGDRLQARFSNGRLASIEGEARSGARASGEFKPSDPRRALERAREILREAGPLLGLEPTSPLDEGTASPGAISAQVVFRENLGGIPVSPKGNVSVTLGPDGELIGLSSDYVPSLRTENSRALSADQAGKAAQAALASVSDTDVRPASVAASVEGGTPLIWVGQSGSSSSGRHAYEYFQKGQQIIVDAETGKVLFRRDRRTH